MPTGEDMVSMFIFFAETTLWAIDQSTAFGLLQKGKGGG